MDGLGTLAATPLVIPVLSIPVINRPDQLEACIASIDHPVELLLIIDNSPETEMGEVADRAAMLNEHVRNVWVIEPPNNIGYTAAVNLTITSLPHLPWWCIANADVVFGPGDLARLAEVMAIGGPRWIGITDWRVFGLSFEAVEAVGLWDANLHPAFVEDCDYEYRCKLAGVVATTIDGTTSHTGSTSIRSDIRYATANFKRSYPSNVAYFIAKWGGPMRGGEKFTTPFDQGGSIKDWTLDIRRLRDNAW